jgi:apolipoprotein N-acyltransferase
MAFVLGAAAALALPPVHLVPVLLASLPGLLVMATAAPTARRAALVGLFWGWGFHVAGLHWLTYAVLTEVERFWWLVPIAVPALALPLGAFTVIPVLVARLARLAGRAGWPSPQPGRRPRCCAACCSPAFPGTCSARSGRSARCRSRPPPGSGCTG